MNFWIDVYFKARAACLAGKEPPWLLKHPRYAYIWRTAASCVAWPGNKAAVRAIYRDAKRRGMSVDHIIPVSHPYVCGLTVPNNLRIVPHAVNLAKGNKWAPDQLEAWPMEPEPHQQRLAV